MSIKITTLVENSVYGKGLQGEHGLSLLVDTGEHRLLFDTGAHQFSAAFSVSPINYLLQLRITHSKRLLCDTDYSITQIAESSGFSSQNYFTQAFKKLVGVSPRAYRQKHQK